MQNKTKQKKNTKRKIQKNTENKKKTHVNLKPLNMH